MNWHMLRVLSAVFIFIPLAMSPAFIHSLVSADGGLAPLGESMLISLFLGSLLFIIQRQKVSSPFKARQAYLAVALAWIGLSLVGSLPYLLFENAHLSFTDSFFESLSGLTTTGSTILQDIKILPDSLILWRASTHWIGGMGIILLTLAILPLIGVGGMDLYSAEVPGPISDKIAPKLSTTAKLLWGVYVLFTALEFFALWIAGMTPFEALTHSFATLATGGFSSENTSIAAFDNSAIHWIIIIFMFLAGVNFSLHYFALRGKFKNYIKDKEFLIYVSVIFIATVLIFMNVAPVIADPLLRLRDVVFQVVSIITTTGFGTSDFDRWPEFSRFVILSLMFIGGMGGSTAGGIKVMRVYILIKYTFQQIQKIIHPRQVKVLIIGGRHIPESVVHSVIQFMMIYLLLFFTATSIIVFLGNDILSSFSAVAATLNNIGPGLNAVGPTQNFAHFGNLAKWVLSFCMLAGRLEIIALLLLFYPGTWKKV